MNATSDPIVVEIKDVLAFQPEDFPSYLRVLKNVPMLYPSLRLLLILIFCTTSYAQKSLSLYLRYLPQPVSFPWGFAKCIPDKFVISSQTIDTTLDKQNAWVLGNNFNSVVKYFMDIE